MLHKDLLFNSLSQSANLITETSRDLYRHSNGCCTVIEFDIWNVD